MVAALLVGAVLVVGRAARREQDDVARPRRLVGRGDRPLEVAARRAIGTPVGASAVVQRGGGLADQIDGAAALADRRGERRVVRALAATAGDQVHAARERADADLGRRDVGRLGVVDVGHAVDRARSPRAGAGRRRTSRSPSRTAPAVDPAGEADRRGGHRVLAVVRRRGGGCRRPPSAARRARTACPSRWARSGSRAVAERDRGGRAARVVERQAGGDDRERPRRLVGEDLELRGAVVRRRSRGGRGGPRRG